MRCHTGAGLQEVEFDVFDKDLVPALEACGYKGMGFVEGVSLLCELPSCTITANR
eukprot:m.1267007 g.1267007  ORF g.1267007 m.1267007 type:complete len:55 (-) comp24741_c0_seq58:3289-3453(-)